MTRHIILEKQAEGGFVAYIPELPGCHTQGETRAEAIRNIKEACELYLEVLKGKNVRSLQKVEVIPIPG
ncbi:MAG: type II toxin-antitoxin system HicB family antitoxin [Candidatus Micrarchaeia archaeon]|jgi:predicted RNase H-like HicB family nuclease